MRLSTIFLTTLGAVSALVAAAQALAEPLSVTIEGVEARGGTLYVSVQDESQFMQQASITSETVDRPRAGDVEFTFDVEPGDYAVTVWHDDDADGTFTMAPSGMPLDGWALSGNPTAMPSFEGSKVEVTEEGGVAVAAMRYAR